MWELTDIVTQVGELTYYCTNVGILIINRCAQTQVLIGINIQKFIQAQCISIGLAILDQILEIIQLTILGILANISCHGMWM